MVLKDKKTKLSHDFHAGYNIQVMVSSGLITMYGVFQDRSDHYTFISMNDLYFKYYSYIIIFMYYGQVEKICWNQNGNIIDYFRR